VDLEKQELWKKRMEHYQASGLSGTEWCKQQGIPEGQFWYWRRRWKDSLTKKEEASTWAPLVVADPTPHESTLMVRIGTLEIEIKPGYNATLLQDVVRTLMSIC
jgi:hypothetical protein